MFLLPVGGAGLAGGFAYDAKTALADSRVIGGRQHEGSPALALSLERGEAVVAFPAFATHRGRARGGHRPDRLRRAGGRGIDGVVLLSEAETLRRVRSTLDRYEYLIEPSSAVTVAAHPDRQGGPSSRRSTVAAIAGRNVGAARTIRNIRADRRA